MIQTKDKLGGGQNAEVQKKPSDSNENTGIDKLKELLPSTGDSIPIIAIKTIIIVVILNIILLIIEHIRIKEK